MRGMVVKSRVIPTRTTLQATFSVKFSVFDLWVQVSSANGYNRTRPAPFLLAILVYVEVPIHLTRFHVRRFTAITAGTVPQERYRDIRSEVIEGNR